ncbi:hypothetical protein SODALDRAFT_200044 [Sodiomyces alkalinus F11]|uniref:Uncharacterized protein n=1 Tax=Sodiomyces alkalinus (strain CBS 110278 / VKM F-3762 / F11) TaxID=1314773 RepID=A0A3N2PSS7_SODAK|nr:hypothetical protein SODALDRAFT_200044 [Sodiomyces alkalinus F11]ROT37565.1 hypothetical protein SODALDRAFT_200044 [Sodiomyces alkalinus F11]
MPACSIPAFAGAQLVGMSEKCLILCHSPSWVVVNRPMLLLLLPRISNYCHLRLARRVVANRAEGKKERKKKKEKKKRGGGGSGSWELTLSRVQGPIAALPVYSPESWVGSAANFGPSEGREGYTDRTTQQCNEDKLRSVPEKIGIVATSIKLANPFPDGKEKPPSTLPSGFFLLTLYTCIATSQPQWKSDGPVSCDLDN